MRNLTRAERKKAKRSFKVGDVVTWGDGCISHVVIDVRDDGVVVDTTSVELGMKHADGRYSLLVLYDGNIRRYEGYFTATSKGPPRHSDAEPDKEISRGKD